VHHGSAEEYAHVGEILAGLEAPLFAIPGNRDRREALRGAFGHLSYWPANGDFLHYAIEDTPLRLIALDSVDAGERKGAFCAQRLAWLEETLARQPDRPTILFIHHPPFDIPEHFVGGYRHPRDAEALTAVVRRHPQVVRLLCGHVHFQYRQPGAAPPPPPCPAPPSTCARRSMGAVEAAPLYLLHVAANDGALTSHTRIVAA